MSYRIFTNNKINLKIRTRRCPLKTNKSNYQKKQNSKLSESNKRGCLLKKKIMLEKLIMKHIERTEKNKECKEYKLVSQKNSCYKKRKIN